VQNVGDSESTPVKKMKDVLTNPEKTYGDDVSAAAEEILGADSTPEEQADLMAEAAEGLVGSLEEISDNEAVPTSVVSGRVDVVRSANFRAKDGVMDLVVKNNLPSRNASGPIERIDNLIPRIDHVDRQAHGL
jgi:hypothetical protein